MQQHTAVADASSAAAAAAVSSSRPTPASPSSLARPPSSLHSFVSCYAPIYLAPILRPSRSPTRPSTASTELTASPFSHHITHHFTDQFGSRWKTRMKNNSSIFSIREHRMTQILRTRRRRTTINRHQLILPLHIYYCSSYCFLPSHYCCCYRSF